MFDAVGNITKKSDYSADSNNAYSYQAGSNKLVSVALKSGGTERYGFDAKVNLTWRNYRTEFTYNAMDKPTRIDRMGSVVNISYDAMDMRFRQVRTKAGVTTTTR